MELSIDTCKSTIRSFLNFLSSSVSDFHLPPLKLLSDKQTQTIVLLLEEPLKLKWGGLINKEIYAEARELLDTTDLWKKLNVCKPVYKICMKKVTDGSSCCQSLFRTLLVHCSYTKLFFLLYLSFATTRNHYYWLHLNCSNMLRKYNWPIVVFTIQGVIVLLIIFEVLAGCYLH